MIEIFTLFELKAGKAMLKLRPKLSCKCLTLSFMLLMFFSINSIAKENRCGLVEVFSEDNIIFSTKDSKWFISIPKKHDALGLGELKDFRVEDNVITNEKLGYGYGCYCLSIDLDYKNKKITRIFKAKNVAISTCKYNQNSTDHIE